MDRTYTYITTLWYILVGCTQISFRDHPHLPGNHASLHPCRLGMGDVMKKIIDALMSLPGSFPCMQVTCHMSFWLKLQFTTTKPVLAGKRHFIVRDPPLPHQRWPENLTTRLTARDIVPLWKMQNNESSSLPNRPNHGVVKYNLL